MSTQHVERKIAEILKIRHNKLPRIEADIAQWEQLKQRLVALEGAVNTLRQHEKTDTETKEALLSLRFNPIDEAISTNLANLSLLKARFARTTLNIGVSGRARVGKSTLLQSIAGLTDEQIPTGRTVPVTAVRSRIFHSKQSRATLVLHSYESFRRDILQPFHDALDLHEAPQSLAQFSSYAYPRTVADLSAAKQQESSAITVLNRLREMQASLPTYEADLTGTEKLIGLEHLRQYVAYPTEEERSVANQAGTVVSRRYLAVKDVQIECEFPYARVGQIGIVDLPGLGELTANAEEHHLEGLQNDVDLVLLIKRPSETMAYWGKEDGAATNLLDKARGFIKNRRDFVYIILNTGGVEPDLISAVRSDILRSVNDGQPGKHFQVLETNARDPQAVYQDALEPVLAHLTERLSVMDEQVLEGTAALSAGIHQRVEQALMDVESAIRLGKSKQLGASSQEKLEQATRAMREDLSVSLKSTLDDLHKKARDITGQENQTYENAVEEAYQKAKEWVDNGLGYDDTQQWLDHAFKQFTLNKGTAGFATDELNRIRVEISNHFSDIDNHFKQSLDEVWAHLVDGILNRHCGNLLQGQTGRDGLELLGALLRNAQEPCDNLQKAVGDLLSTRLDYRTQLHPKVRRALDELEGEVFDPENNQMQARFPVAQSQAGAQELLREITILSNAVLYKARKQLLAEALVPSLVIHAAVEQFDDAWIRSGSSELEFRRLARCYRDDIWPGEFSGFEAATARVMDVHNAVKAVRQALPAA